MNVPFSPLRSQTPDAVGHVAQRSGVTLIEPAAVNEQQVLIANRRGAFSEAELLRENGKARFGLGI